MPERIEICVIPQDLRHEETIVQIADALDNLESAVTNIFDSINNRIAENSKRLGIIKERATKLQKKVEYIQTNLSLKAIKIYSAAKYPANQTYKEYQTILTPTNKNENENDTNSIYKSNISIENKFETSSTGNAQSENKQYASVDLQEKLQFYHVKTKQPKKNADAKKGELQSRVSSVSALLPFNDWTRGESLNIFATNQNEDKHKIEDAPDSISQPWKSSEIESPSGYMYTPTLGEVPQIDVPLTLPDLPGIVDDERFVLDLTSQNPIAPSSATPTPTIAVDLPSLPPTSVDQKAEVNESPLNLPNFEKTESSSSKKETQTAPPPPPPPPPAPLSNMAIVPPPPPPPGPPKEMEKPRNAVQETSGDDRTNLMAEIRKAGGFGGAKLRSAAPIDEKDDRWASASVGGDLMADLHAKLALRRKGIAGVASGAFQRMSSLIPPPPKPNEEYDGNSGASECDSQPDDEWE